MIAPGLKQHPSGLDDKISIQTLRVSLLLIKNYVPWTRTGIESWLRVFQIKVLNGMVAYHAKLSRFEYPRIHLK